MTFPNLTFDNQFHDQLPADTESEVYPRQVNAAAYSNVEPTKVSSPTLIAWSSDCADLLGLSDVKGEALADFLVGNILHPDSTPYAMNYGGHQFGHWAGQLGDGRAINLGEVNTDNGHFTLQLKGAGLTPYSRSADGLAVLRSSVREFLCSEAMYYLGIPTTRALSLCLTGEQVMRDMFYSGDNQLEPGAIVCRVSPSFMRFGSFQLPASRGDKALLKQLVDYCISRDFAHLISDNDINKDTYLAWFEEVCERTSTMIVHWLRVGFVHGVMNTDNMSIIGETIDYGPYGWIDNFDLHWTPNTTDAQGKRYRFGSQGEIAQWNLFQLANAIYPLIEESKPLENALNDFAKQFHQKWLEMMASKIGLDTLVEGDDSLLLSLEDTLQALSLDMTIFYRLLTQVDNTTAPFDASSAKDLVEPACYAPLNDDQCLSLVAWLNSYIERLNKSKLSPEQRITLMNATNPKYVLRNYLAQQAIDKATQGDFSEVNTLLTLLKKPYDEQPDFEHYASKRPDWALNKAGCSMLSCSS
ncbi:protein adenylyltransferase SelO [Thalassotalea agarivorans]|uniref:Protein nucleotidyltransferase YdiU n=1 Tax=Thalassotalea agarivorans TaxID=349064 RepID=A0A1I0AIF5_THASX|nr:YdiU family protein [Thalassotalea agarivorans]SES94078.1 Uncharacterized conserved protein YdiU, UPF0061 family [Thalassotalea agarivorans]